MAKTKMADKRDLDSLTFLEIASKRAGQSEGDKVSAAIQGMKSLELAALVDEISDKEEKNGEISNFEAGLRETARGKLQDHRAQNEMREKGMVS